MVEKLGPEAWIEAGFVALVQGGIEAVRVETLAKSLGVTKGSFYWHFEDRRKLLDGMLAWWRSEATFKVMAHVDQVGGNAAQKLQTLLDLSTSGIGDQIEGAVRAWAGSADPIAQEIVQGVDREREKYVVELFREHGLSKETAVKRARILYLAMIGEFTWTSHGSKASPRGTWTELYALLIAL